MNSFASGPKSHYYGKGDVLVHRLKRRGTAAGEQSPVLSATVLMLVYGDALWETYNTGDNAAVVATDSMKNFIQRETLNFEGEDLEGLCRFLGEKFIGKYSQIDGIQVSAAELPYEALEANAFSPGGPERATARVEIGRQGLIEAVSGMEGFKLLRLSGSAFQGFVRDEYTTLQDLKDRPLHMWLDVGWSYRAPEAAFTSGTASARVRATVRHVFASFESRSIQQLIYEMATQLLAAVPAMSEVRLEAANRTWATIAEQGDALGVYTDAGPAFGCLGLTLRRS